jgi:uncharacterized protein
MCAAAEEEAKSNNGGSVPNYNYRWEHVIVVVSLAQKLANLVGADEDIVEAAAWLHDVTKQDGEAHALTGADSARRLLAQTNFPPEKIEAVAQAIVDHIGLWRDEPLTNLEAMVLWDADKLSKLGLTAAIHWTGMSMTRGKATTTADLVAKRKQQQWQSKAIASFHTEPARRAAHARWHAFEQYWANLEKELNGDDLG